MGTKWIHQCDMCGVEEEGGDDLFFEKNRTIVTDSAYFRLDCYTRTGQAVSMVGDEHDHGDQRLELKADLCGDCGQRLEKHLQKFFPDHFFVDRETDDG